MTESENQKQDMLTSILNGISAMIYVTDLETDEILFINDYMKHHFKIEGDVIGQPCYKVLNEGIDERCVWCPCHQLDKEPDSEVVWEELNTLTKCHYRNTDKYIDWPNGKKVHIQHCVDITDVKQMQETLKYNNNILQAVNKSAVFLQNTDTESFQNDVHQSMKVIGEAANADRVYIWKNHSINGVLHSTQIYEWSGGADSQQDNKYTVDMPYEKALPGLERLFLNNECLNGITSKMPQEYQDYFIPQSIVSIIMVPIFMHERLWGFVGFDDCRNERVFTDREIATLRSIGLLYANAHQRNEINQSIKDTTDQLRYRDKLLESVNQAAALLLFLDVDYDVKPSIVSSMELIGTAVGVDRVHIWRKHMQSDQFDFVHEYVWLSDEGKTKSEVPMGMITPFINMPEWIQKFKRNEYVGGPFSKLSPEEQEYFSPFDIKTVVLIPLFLNDQLWGLVSVDDCLKERFFTEDELKVLQSLSLMIASAIEHHELIIKDKQSKERMMEMLEQATAASKAKGDFLSNMSHEMRTPLNAIIGMTAIGKKTNELEEKNHALNKIGDASSHLLGLINDVLDMAKIEADKLELDPVEYIFDHMLQKVLTVIHFRSDEKKQTLTVNIDNKIPRTVIGDDQRLAQVLTNILHNAVKFTPENGTILLDISLALETDDYCELRVEVTDDGIGITPEQQEKLFFAFEQAEYGTSREYGGTGLGLPIARRIIELMGGHIGVESELGKGAKFSFTVHVRRSSLCMGIEAKDGTPDASGDTDDELLSGVWKDKHLLVAEDVEINREIIVAFLEDTGLIIDCVENGREALDIISANPEKYDIVFMDVRMPQMDGLEATRRIRALPPRKRNKLPIIAMTANVFKDDVEACIAAGMDDHLGKPLEIDRVINKLRMYL